MARPLRVEFPGAIYHVTGRMAGSWRDERLRLFRDARDYQRFLDRLGEGIGELGVRLYLFCLMANHFHFMLETPEGNLSRLMQKLGTGYALYFNRRHGRHGPLLDGRFKAKVVEGDEYLLKLSRYVHLNPIHVAGWKGRPLTERREHLRAYPWSSYLDYTAGKSRWKFLDMKPVLAQMGGRVRDRPRLYREYVECGMAEDDREMREVMMASPLGIGGEGFQRSLWSFHNKRSAGIEWSEDMAFRRTRKALDPQEVLRVAGEAFGVEVDAFGERRRNSPLRPVAAKLLLRYAGLTQRNVAEVLGMSTGAAVSVQTKKYEPWLCRDKRLAKLVQRIESRLNEMREGC